MQYENVNTPVFWWRINRRKVIYGQPRCQIVTIERKLFVDKGVKIIKGHALF